jgi:hypothetical protein
MEGFEVFANQFAVSRVDPIHLYRRVQRCHEHHEGQW